VAQRVPLDVAQCACDDGSARWGVATIADADLRPGVEFDSFVVSVIAPDGTVLHTVDMNGTDGRLDFEGRRDPLRHHQPPAEGPRPLASGAAGVGGRHAAPDRVRLP